jgi:formimidoylglutamate deiminase
MEHVLLPEGWAEDVIVDVDDAGDLVELERNASTARGRRIAGWVLPGVPNLHSHAHQRAMAGLAERSGEDEDSFWTWREVMYAFLSRIGPDHLQAIAARLYLEMLKAGYTSVAEFQYLHHDPDGQPYDEVAEMSLRTLAAARETGIGITNLPVLYRYGGFGGLDPLPGQRRFLNDGVRFLEIVERLRAESDGNTATGIAPHSLRAVTDELLAAVLSGFDVLGGGPVHIHVAEQAKEVEDCLAWSDERPVDWLLRRFEVDGRWCLVHATHMTGGETAVVAASGAAVGLCPTTEANLGDGLFDAPRYFAAGGRWGIGSDSQISVDPVEELRWLEYGQRAAHRVRTILAGGPGQGTGRTLFEGALAGGAQASGRRIGRIAPGYRADFIALDDGHPLLYGREGDSLLDSWIFSGNVPLVRDVYVGGRHVIRDGRHVDEDAIDTRFRRAIDDLTS